MQAKENEELLTEISPTFQVHSLPKLADMEPVAQQALQQATETIYAAGLPGGRQIHPNQQMTEQANQQADSRTGVRQIRHSQCCADKKPHIAEVKGASRVPVSPAFVDRRAPGLRRGPDRQKLAASALPRPQVDHHGGERIRLAMVPIIIPCGLGNKSRRNGRVAPVTTRGRAIPQGRAWAVL
ncbi:hypothetical protein O988_08714 [Pseudogymnoascus sp. VKM F-3808]|nr:hypothetical protein O988_08714 [Pseudogymnoascus sp. VKM F-3808]